MENILLSIMIFQHIGFVYCLYFLILVSFCQLVMLASFLLLYHCWNHCQNHFQNSCQNHEVPCQNLNEIPCLKTARKNLHQSCFFFLHLFCAYFVFAHRLQSKSKTAKWNARKSLKLRFGYSMGGF